MSRVDPYLLPPVEAKFSMDGPGRFQSVAGGVPVKASVDEWIDVMFVKQVYPWIYYV